PPHGRLLVLANGAYGERMVEIAAAYRIDATVVRSDPAIPVDPAAAGDALARDPGITTVAMVHHETTTGVLNPVGAVGRMVRAHGAALVVDAISSFGGIPFSMEDCGVDFLLSTANKCLQGMAGAAFVISRKDALDAIAPLPRRSYYLSLADLWEHFERTSQTRFTPPVQTLYALRQALDELFQEGVEARYARYCESWRVLRSGLERLGLSILTRPEDESRLLLTVRYPSPAFDFDALHDVLYAEGYTIYPGKIGGAGTFRLSVIGAIDADDIRAFLDALRHALGAAGR
ncbi:MAG TPA: aminotransferase class V-fold PLP-dependent enzyme, partial [Spirochaetia bacterium]|nr:aminotransferase class V-fold PLP-dependent enzyme [Spirochaetia bacterium]